MMTKLILVALLLIISHLSVVAQEYYYYYQGKKQPLELNTDYVFITFRNGIAALEIMNNFIADTELIKTDVDNIKANKSLSLNGITSSWSIIRLTNKLDKKGYFDKLNSLKQIDGMEVVSPFFKTNDTEKVGLSNYFYVKLNKEEDIKLLRKIAGLTNTKIVEQDEFMPLWFTLSCKRMSKGNALEMANYFYETTYFAYAEPDLMVENILNCATDPLYNNQWGLNNTGQNGGIAGIDINVCNAWNITEGSNSIKVAVVDDGIQMTHPDLQANVFGTGYDTGNGTPSSVLRGNHGTSVAGIIAAAKNNGYGIAGVAPSCKLMSVSTSPYSNTNARKKKAEGINWAWQNGADVINCSWGWDPNLSFQVIDDAISNALTQGRGGKGCIIVFAVGNNNSNIFYPANSNPNILAVGAATYCGERKSRTSCDNDNTWGSNFGNQLDIMAPGVSISTTDRTGTSGYVNGDYYTFDKTSAAAPFVAGVSALMLSVNPNLTVEQVNDIIEFTAQKVGSYSYSTTSGRTNGSWHSEMGYGLIDAEAAVCMAKNYASISGSSIVCSTNRTYIINNPAGTTVSWSVSPTNLFAVDTGNGSSFTTRSTNSSTLGYGTITATINGSCGSFPVTKNVWVGKPTITYGGKIGSCYEPIIKYKGPVLQQGVTYNWSVNNPNISLFTNNAFCQLVANIPDGASQNFILTLTISDGNCATTNTKSGVYHKPTLCDCGYGTGCNDDPPFPLSVNPNPANTFIAIELPSENDKKNTQGSRTTGKEKVEVLIFNDKNTPVYSKIMSGKKLRVNTRNLPNGLYYLRIKQGIQVYSRQLVVKH